MSTTAATIIAGALGLIGKVDPEETPGAAMMADGFRRLNLMMGSWSTQGLTIPVTTRQVFPLVAGKGGPSNPYTMGPNGNFNTTRPQALTYAALILGASLPSIVEVPLSPYTEDGYNALPIKELQNAQPTGIYYSDTFAGGLGTVQLWPVPNTTLNTLALTWKQQLGLFTSLTASYDLPEGGDEAVEYQLALRLTRVYSVPLGVLEELKQIAGPSFDAFQRSNVEIVDLSNDFAVNARSAYNINTGQ